MNDINILMQRIDSIEGLLTSKIFNIESLFNQKIYELANASEVRQVVKDEVPYSKQIISGGGSDNSMFSVKSITADTVKIRSGVIKKSGLAAVTVPDTDIVVTLGTEVTPSYITLKVAYDGSYEFVNQSSYPEDTGTHWYYTLYSVYLSEGTAYIVNDCRTEFSLRSPM